MRNKFCLFSYLDFRFICCKREFFFLISLGGEFDFVRELVKGKCGWSVVIEVEGTCWGCYSGGVGRFYLLKLGYWV